LPDAAELRNEVGGAEPLAHREAVDGDDDRLARSRDDREDPVVLLRVDHGGTVHRIGRLAEARVVAADEGEGGRRDEVERLLVLELSSSRDLDRVSALRARERATDRPARRRRAEAVVRDVAACHPVHEAVGGSRGTGGGEGERDDDGPDRPAVSHGEPRVAGGAPLAMVRQGFYLTYRSRRARHVDAEREARSAAPQARRTAPGLIRVD